jgi:pyridoxamine 5'-phosphate oxidase-like protein
MSELRTVAERKAAVMKALEANDHMWLATADSAGIPQLIAVSTLWDGTDLVIATRVETKTARNLAESGRAKLSHGTPDDVILVDAVLEGSAPAGSAGDDLSRRFKQANGWDPAEEGDDWGFYRLRPRRIQAYRGYGELEGRDVMKGGRWLA